MKKFLILSAIVFCINAHASDTKVLKALQFVLNDSVVASYLPGTDTISLILFERSGNFHYYNNYLSWIKDSSGNDPGINGIVKKLKVSVDKATVRIHFKESGLKVRVKLKKDDKCDCLPWRIRSRFIRDSFHGFPTRYGIWLYSFET
jgi:hypothetical protein